MKNLVIVESPAKAKTIEKYLGSDFIVRSSFGHIRDLPSKNLNIDIENNFEPHYEITPDKKKVIAELKKYSKNADKVYLASDEDREGEAIAWHLCFALGLDPVKTDRMVFHEITKTAITEALSHPRKIDQNIVNAQQARRVLDRLVGYGLSPVLWRTIQTGISAGRVQSVAVRLIVEREEEIIKHVAETTFKVSAEFKSDSTVFNAEYASKPKDFDDAKSLLQTIFGLDYEVTNIETKPGKRSPSPPFTTSTLQQEAGKKLGYSVKQTMTVAQRLYEAGLITYMRTDSTNLSAAAIQMAEKYIKDSYGQNYSNPTNFSTKDALSQQAHEAIRPTHPETVSLSGEQSSLNSLYKLIWKRFLASQMSKAEVSKSVLYINDTSKKHTFTAKGEILLFDGFLKVYGGAKEDQILPKVEIGESLTSDSMTALEVYGKTPNRYSEPTLVKELEEKGIGRPSTYAPTINTIQMRGYVEKKDQPSISRKVRELKISKKGLTESEKTDNYGEARNKLFPTPLGIRVTEFLKKHFAPIVDYDFTRDAEEMFDKIENGKIKWQEMISLFYHGEFTPLINKSKDITRKDTSNARTLGKDPKTGLPILARYGRFGPMLQLGDPDPDDKTTKPKFSPMPEGVNLEDVTLEQALKMFELPRIVGNGQDGTAITADIGRFGPYIKYQSMFVSIKDYSPFEITLEQSMELIKEKQEKLKASIIHDFGSVIVKVGQYGPYVTDGKKNAKIPKTTDPKKLTLASAQKLLDEAATKPKWGRKTAAKTTAKSKTSRAKKPATKPRVKKK